MFRYITDVSKLSHYIIKNFCNNFGVAVDATLGNGYDTDFLSNNFNKVYSFDIQLCAIEAYKKKSKGNTTLINDSHENFNIYINDEIDCLMYNLGFMPGGNKKLTTRAKSTMLSLKCGLNKLRKGGLITIAAYKEHAEGKEEEILLIDFVKRLPKNKYAVMLHSFVNRDVNAPILIVIEKK
ncbi:rRNA methylase [Clostridium sp. P21]|uniref:rRNA methylase n=1 Tax=Clostridium muellerianum TaxID=2716538 RepID=A0A7Y0HN07_9CLOT|nr:class I SAM-dependent methyltransferase [Clostridium muellerianum]NMM62700.1 rRNA methylase [Clostridium muellerianum]